MRGRCAALNVRGTPGESERNRFSVDLSDAQITWLNADYGVDLAAAILPSDGSCMVVTDRIRAVEVMGDRLRSSAGVVGRRVADAMTALYSADAISPLEASQTTVFISVGMVEKMSRGSDRQDAETVFGLMRGVAEEEGVLSANSK